MKLQLLSHEHSLLDSLLGHVFLMYKDSGLNTQVQSFWLHTPTCVALLLLIMIHVYIYILWIGDQGTRLPNPANVPSPAPTPHTLVIECHCNMWLRTLDSVEVVNEEPSSNLNSLNL